MYFIRSRTCAITSGFGGANKCSLNEAVNDEDEAQPDNLRHPAKHLGDLAMTHRDSRKAAWRLGIDWYRPKEEKQERSERYSGELLYSANRLRLVKLELEEAVQIEDLSKAYERVEFHLENYFNHIYQLTERAFRALCLRTGVNYKDIKDKKGRSNREDLRRRFESIAPKPTKTLLQLLRCVDHHIAIRGRHTHERFFRIRLNNGREDFDPSDVLTDAKGDVEIERNLRTMLERLTRPYRETIERVVKLTYALVDNVEGSTRLGPE